MIYLFTKLFSLICAVLLLLLTPSVVLASEIRLDANKTGARVGEEFIVSAIVHTKENVNAVESQIIFPSNLLEVKEIRDGNSVINLWAEKPQEKQGARDKEQGRIVFSGITPGGFSGANQYLFSIVFTAKETGSATIAFEDTQMLKNDGLGTKIITTTRPVEIIIQPGDDAVRRERIIDMELPSYFAPTIASDPHLFDGKHFIAFATQDKNSGISHYDILETRSEIQGIWQWMPRRWKIAESPYVLKDQALRSYVYVRAIDNAGNERIAMIPPRYPLKWYEQREGWITIVIIFGILYLVYRAYRIWNTRRYRHSKI